MKRLAIIIAAIVLGGCSSLAPKPVQVSASELHLSGRLSVQVEGQLDQRANGGNASFDLSGGPARGELDLSTPLGSLMARARWDDSAGLVALETPKGEQRFDDLAALTQQMLGESIPVAAMFDWLQGRAWSGAPSSPLPEAGNIGFAQLGWRVDLRRYADGIIVATRQGQPIVTLRAQIEKD